MPTPGVIVTTSLSAKFIGAAAVAVAALGATSAAHARADVYVSFGVQGAPVYVQPAPVYVQPRPVYVQPEPVYVQPRPVYVQPPVYSAPEEAYVRPWPPGYDAAYEQERAWRRAEWHRRYWRHHHRDWDGNSHRGRNWD